MESGEGQGEMAKSAETTMNLWVHADMFRKAGQVLLGAGHPVPVGALLPTYYVVCHALELSMKAFLRARGYKADALIHKFGHDLRKCLRKAQAKGFSTFVKLDAEETNAIIWISPQYRAKELEYVVSQGFKSLPEISHLVSALDKIMKGIRRECFEATVREKGLPKEARI